MTSLLDPAQIEERERRRVKQLVQQVGVCHEGIAGGGAAYTFSSLEFISLCVDRQRSRLRWRSAGS